MQERHINVEQLNASRITYESNGNSLEALVFKPNGEGPFPLVCFVHGHGMSGAWDMSLIGHFLRADGFVALLPSQVGYGLSQGKRDFCGPSTVQGVVDSIHIAKELPFVDRNRIGIWGVSRGATVASQVITTEPDLVQTAVLQSGVYDMSKEVEWPDLIVGIREAMIAETGGTKEAWEERSSIVNMNRTTASILILHGDKDDRVSVQQAYLLDKRLQELGKPHELIIMKGFDHYLLKDSRLRYTFPFLNKHLKASE